MGVSPFVKKHEFLGVLPATANGRIPDIRYQDLLILNTIKILKRLISRGNNSIVSFP